MSRAYLTDAEPDFRIEISEPDVEREREMSQAEQPGIEYPYGYLETLAVYRRITEILLDDHCVLMHGAAIAMDGNAYIFTAKTGTGKTTHVRLWQKRFGDRVTVINGDKPILCMRNGILTACGTPWSGKECLNTNIELPVKAICLLDRYPCNRIESAGLREMLPVLLGQSYIPAGKDSFRKVLRFWAETEARISYFHLLCNTEPDAAEVSYYGMNGASR